MTNLLKYILATSFLTVLGAQAQSLGSQKAVARITATATVVGNVDLIVKNDLEFEVSSLSPTELTLNPQTDPRCGEIEIIGSPNSMVRVTSEKESVLRHESGDSRLFFTYNFSGNTDEIQAESALLTQTNRIMLGENGIYYLWVGGQLSGLEDIMPGNYTMVLTIDVEYVQ